MYDDGAVSIARDKRVGDGFVIAMFSLQLTATELAKLRAAALTGGLGTGGIHAAGTTAGSADGGGSVFFSRHGALGTGIEAPLLFGDDLAGWGDGDPKQRAGLLAVQKQLNAVADRTDAMPASMSDRGPAPSGRPLLPHEKTCADVQAWDSTLAAQSRARLVSP